MPTLERIAPPPRPARPPRPAEIDPNWRRRRRIWTDDRLAALEMLIEKGWTSPRIAKHLGVSVNGVNIARKRHGLKSLTEATLNCRKVAAQLGLGCAKKVADWIERGWLEAKRGQRRGANRQWLITEEAVLDCLRDERTWIAWDPERIPDPLLREWARELRAGIRFLSVGEVARRFHVDQRTVNKWVRRGELPAVGKWPNWWFRESDLVGFVPPCERSRARKPIRRWTPQEEAELIRRRLAGESWKAIGRALRCAERTAAARFDVLDRQNHPALPWEDVPIRLPGVQLVEVLRRGRAAGRRTKEATAA